jgi:hypothetical protein
LYWLTINGTYCTIHSLDAGKSIPFATKPLPIRPDDLQNMPIGPLLCLEFTHTHAFDNYIQLYPPQPAKSLNVLDDLIIPIADRTPPTPSILIASFSPIA